MPDVKHCKRIWDSLLAKHDTLTNLLVANTAASVGFDIEQIKKSDENTQLAKPIEKLGVKEAEIDDILSYHKQYTRPTDLATRFVDRMPGLINVTREQDLVFECVETINVLKGEWLEAVKEGVPNAEALHKFIHEHFERVMTQQVRRKIMVIDKPVERAWFNWTSRPVSEKLSVEEAKAYIKAQKLAPTKYILTPEFEAMCDAAVELLERQPWKTIHRQKEVTLLPIVTYTARLEDGSVKRYSANANVPMILTRQPSRRLPEVSALKNYELEHDKRRRPTKAKTIIHAALKVVGVAG